MSSTLVHAFFFMPLLGSCLQIYLVLKSVTTYKLHAEITSEHCIHSTHSNMSYWGSNKDPVIYPFMCVRI